MRNAAIEATETRQFFEINLELRELRRSSLADRKQKKAELLDELEAMQMHTTQPTLAARCRRLTAEFEYIRRELANGSKRSVNSQ